MAKIRPHPIWGMGNRQPTDLKKKRGKFGSTTRSSPKVKAQTEKELRPTTAFAAQRSPRAMMGGMGDMAPSLNHLNRQVLNHIAMREPGLLEKDTKRLRRAIGR